MFLNDSWQATRRLTVNAGLRFDRHSAYLPDQVGPGWPGVRARATTSSTFNNWGPRLGASFDLTGDAKTVAKVSYGRFWLYPGADLASGLNPNATMWFERYGWADRNGNGIFDSGEQGALQLVQGGRASTVFDENLENTYVEPVHRLRRARGDEQLRRAHRLRVERPAPGARADQRQPAARGLHRAGDLPGPRARRQLRHRRRRRDR